MQEVISALHYSVISLPWQPPILLAEKIKSLGYMVWLDSTRDIQYAAEEEKQYDIFTAWPECVIHAWGLNLDIINPASGEVKKITQNPFSYIEALLQQLPSCDAPADLPFCGGIAGYWGYELNHITEPACIPERKNACPDMSVGFYLWSLIADHNNKKLLLVFHPHLAEEKRNHILQTINCITYTKIKPPRLKSNFLPQMTFQDYQYAFDKIKKYINAGDCYQVNLTQQFSTEYQGSLWPAYQHLRKTSPTPFSAYIDMGELQILSHSPERFIRLNNKNVEAMPIKGTHARSSCHIEDKIYAENLLSSEKDRAENLMIVDLLRNDLNRYCQVNSVKVPELCKLKSYTNVHHLVSTVRGQLKPDITPVNLLKGIFPGGSISGAPKIRAMQIIREVEPVPRCVYCGAIGYISFNDNMDTNISIRTLVGNKGKLSCWGGGGIVSDSDCTKEFEESIVKIANLTSCLEMRYLY